MNCMNTFAGNSYIWKGWDFSVVLEITISVNFLQTHMFIEIKLVTQLGTPIQRFFLQVSLWVIPWLVSKSANSLLGWLEFGWKLLPRQCNVSESFCHGFELIIGRTFYHFLILFHHLYWCMAFDRQLLSNKRVDTEHSKGFKYLMKPVQNYSMNLISSTRGTL